MYVTVLRIPKCFGVFGARGSLLARANKVKGGGTLKKRDIVSMECGPPRREAARATLSLSPHTHIVRTSLFTEEPCSSSSLPRGSTILFSPSSHSSHTILAYYVHSKFLSCAYFGNNWFSQFFNFLDI